MGIIKVEFEIGKSKADKIIIWLVWTACHYVKRYFQIFDKNYSKFRSKSKIPSFISIDFNKKLYPFIIFFMIAPMVFIIFACKYIPEQVMMVIAIVYVSFVAIVFIVGFIYTVYRAVIDIFISIICFVRSFVVTTLYSIGRLVKMLKGEKRIEE